MQTINSLLLGRNLGFGLSDLGFQAAGIEPGQQLAALHAVPFLNQNSGDALAVMKSQLHLP